MEVTWLRAENENEITGAIICRLYRWIPPKPDSPIIIVIKILNSAFLTSCSVLKCSQYTRMLTIQILVTQTIGVNSDLQCYHLQQHESKRC